MLQIVVSLLNDRPSANDFFNSTVLQEWTRATNVRLRFLRTKTLLGHLMSVARQDPTVTRRVSYVANWHRIVYWFNGLAVVKVSADRFLNWVYYCVCCTLKEHTDTPYSATWCASFMASVTMTLISCSDL
jgi:hypothetical protein